MHIVNKKGDIIRIKPHINYKTWKRLYYIDIYEYSGHIKATNKIIALFKFCLKHPLIFFKVGGDTD